MLEEDKLTGLCWPVEQPDIYTTTLERSMKEVKLKEKGYLWAEIQKVITYRNAIRALFKKVEEDPRSCPYDIEPIDASRTETGRHGAKAAFREVRPSTFAFTLWVATVQHSQALQTDSVIRSDRTPR
ncbi:hypothetical protein B7463_g5954, partial [Scytalidium lignicola]